jgi:hypothetical protein
LHSQFTAVHCAARCSVPLAKLLQTTGTLCDKHRSLLSADEVMSDDTYHICDIVQYSHGKHVVTSVRNVGLDTVDRLHQGDNR